MLGVPQQHCRNFKIALLKRKYAILFSMLMTLDTTYARFELPTAVQQRLQNLLDKQDSGLRLTEMEQLEAAGLIELAEFLSLLRLRAERVEWGA